MQIQPPPEKFLSTLLEIRNYYAPLVDKYGKLYREALDNLTHVQALLSNWALQEEASSQGFSQQGREEILTLPTQQNTNGTHPEVSKTEPKLVASNDTELPKQNNITTAGISSQNQVSLIEENLSHGSSLDVSPDENESDEADNFEEILAINAEVNATKETNTKDDTDNALRATRELAQPSTSESSPQEDKPRVTASTKQKETTIAPDKSLYGQDIPMLGEYQSLKRIEAVEKLLQQHKGSVCHIDFVVRSLYGELEPKAWKVVKGRVQSTLTQGRESGKWSLVPGKPGYYTIDLKLLNSSRKGSSSKNSQTKNEKPQTEVQANISTESSSKQGQTQSKKPDPQAKANAIPLKEEFEGKFLIDAITLLLQQNPRKVFDSGEVIHRLYGELQPEQVKQVKPAVLNELSRGFRTGRFSRVPEEKGLYIWDTKWLPD
ncbi:hypothetical protein H6G76_17720 [Nostoc sp. FACHB-152]|uniref:hypothetical protein n=1 Tax=unclassified Nostoc TaxID=2593658 RepID=UPI0016870156|nr:MULTISPECIES: hypothetical protein [unclassified Nostoc]MBD2448959.1 hypothetical protein [Nostoc sp. FACHB-152]MBD2469427.1 hypothetical protein [Nostoc sp. FACHB-145]